MILKNKFLQLFCIFLIAYSILGGLLLPLSPNIESIEYTKEDSIIQFKLFVPKVTSLKNDVYLIKNTLKNEPKTILIPIKNIKLNDTIFVDFLSPNYFKGVKKGESFDILCSNSMDGDMYYFSAFYIDTAIANTLTPKVLLPNNNLKKFKWSFPNRNILKESIRNLFFHVPMWFTMIALLIYSLVYSIKYLLKGHILDDIKASEGAYMALFFGFIGILTGMIWAKHTWGTYWTNDPKLNGAAIGMLAYFAYMILRNSIPDTIKKARLSAVYNIFSFTIYMVFIMILPRINDSLHPGNGGNPGFNIYEQDNTMRLFFYPAVIGWILLGFWLKDIKVYLKSKNE